MNFIVGLSPGIGTGLAKRSETKFYVMATLLYTALGLGIYFLLYKSVNWFENI